MLGKIRTQLGDLDPIYPEKPELESAESYVGFHNQKKIWLRVVCNATPIITSRCKEIGFPKFYKEFDHDPPIVAFDDCARLDHILREEKTAAPRKAIESFIESLESAMAFQKDVSLAPTLVFVHKGVVLFCYLSTQEQKKTTLFSWVYALITGEADFLYDNDPQSLIAKWEGKLPDILVQNDSSEDNLRHQLELVREWLSSSHLKMMHESPGDANKIETETMMSGLTGVIGAWGFRASISSVLLEPDILSPTDIQKIISWIPKWTPKILRWNYNRRLPSPSLHWFTNLIRYANSLITDETIINCFPTIVWTSIFINQTNDQLPTSSDGILEELKKKPWQSSEIVAWLNDPRFINLWQVLGSNRIALLPLAILVMPEKLNHSEFNLALTCITEANQIESSEARECFWDLIKELILQLTPTWEHADVPKDTIEILEDILTINRNNPPDNNLPRIEAMASMIAVHDWTRRNDTLHAMGETYQILRSSFNRTLVDHKSPYLDFSEIIIEYGRSFSDRSWKQLAKEWLQKYSDHQLANVVKTYV